MLRIITSTGDGLFRFVNIDDLEWPWTPKIGGFGDFFHSFLAAVHISTVNCDEMIIEIDQDNLTLPYLWGEQALTPAQCWGHISLA